MRYIARKMVLHAMNVCINDQEPGTTPGRTTEDIAGQPARMIAWVCDPYHRSGQLRHNSGAKLVQ